MITCTLDLSDFHRKVKQTIDTAQVGALAAARKAAQEGAAHAKAMGRFQDRTGNLRGHIYAKFVSGNDNGAKWAIISPEKYSKFVENGTAPHVILPKAQNGYSGPTRRGQTRRKDNDVGVGRGHALRWLVGGVARFARVVHHPGSKPHPFMEYAFRKAEWVIWRELEDTERKIRRIWNV